MASDATEDPTHADELSGIVQQEARRVLSDAHFEPKPELVAAGWERRFVTDGRRAQELVDLYTETGFEVHLEPLRAEEFDDECAECALLALLQFSTIYTRRKPKPEAGK